MTILVGIFFLWVLSNEFTESKGRISILEKYNILNETKKSITGLSVRVLYIRNNILSDKLCLESFANMKYHNYSIDILLDFQGCYNSGLYVYFEICLMNIFSYMVTQLNLNIPHNCYLFSNIGKVDLDFNRSKGRMHHFLIQAMLNRICKKQLYDDSVLPNCLLEVRNSISKTISYPLLVRETIYNIIRTEGFSIIGHHIPFRNNIITIYNRFDALNHRCLVNAEYVAQILKKSLPNYEVDIVHKISNNISVSIHLFSSSKIFIAPHGGWIPNVIFSPDNGIIFILQKNMLKPAFNMWDITFRTSKLRVIDVSHVKSSQVSNDNVIKDRLYCDLLYYGDDIQKNNISLLNPECLLQKIL